MFAFSASISFETAHELQSFHIQALHPLIITIRDTTAEFSWQRTGFSTTKVHVIRILGGHQIGSIARAGPCTPAHLRRARHVPLAGLRQAAHQLQAVAEPGLRGGT